MMVLDCWLFLLLIPLSVFLTWWFLRQKTVLLPSTTISSEYFKGLNFILNERPDRAIDIFLKLLEVDNQTVETHLALGSLFRQRGEVERAIRIHQNLIARPTLSNEQRALASLELGMDYMCSGLLGHAEVLFKEMSSGKGKYVNESNEQLLIIYQQGKDWDQAIEVAKRFRSIKRDKINPMIAQFYCEKAILAREQNDYKQALSYLKRALKFNKNCVRASILEAEILLQDNLIKAAMKAYQRVEKQNDVYFPEVILPLMDCYKKLDKLDQFGDYLARFLKKSDYPVYLRMVLADIIAYQENEQVAIEFITNELNQTPSIVGVSKLIEHTLQRPESDIRHHLVLIQNAVNKLSQTKTMHRCVKCGFDAKLLYWQCPGCKQWDSMKPVYT